MKTQIAMLLFLLTSFTAQFRPVQETLPQLDALLLAFKQKKQVPLNAHLANSYIIKSIPHGLESQVLPQLLSAYPDFESYTITSTVKEARGTRVYATFNAKQFPIKINLLINEKQKIQELNLIDEENTEVKQMERK